MDINPINRSINIPPPPVVSSNAPAAEEIQVQAAETAKVTQPPASGDSAPQGGTSGQPGLGGHLDLYASEESAMADEKSATGNKAVPGEKTPKESPLKNLHLLGKGEGLPDAADVPPEPEFPFLIPLGSKTPGQVIDAKI
jgi:hypothetical protein